MVTAVGTYLAFTTVAIRGAIHETIMRSIRIDRASGCIHRHRAADSPTGRTASQQPKRDHSAIGPERWRDQRTQSCGQADADAKQREKEIAAARRKGEISQKKADKLKEESSNQREKEKTEAREDAAIAAVHGDQADAKSRSPQSSRRCFEPNYRDGSRTTRALRYERCNAVQRQ